LAESPRTVTFFATSERSLRLPDKRRYASAFTKGEMIMKTTTSKTLTKKLSLNKDTLRQLNPQDLGQAAGGFMRRSNEPSCLGAGSCTSDH
jgi:hypothetical protein